MSRSILRTIAGVALVAALPALSQAQNACTVNVASPGPGNCAVNLGMSVSVPVLAYLNIPVTDIAFPAPDWNAFLAAPTTTTTVTSTQLTIRTNSTYSVALSSAGWDAPANWTLGDVRFGLNGTACTLPAQVPSTLAANQTLALPGTATNSYQQFLCLGLVYPGDLSDTKLTPGTFDLPLVLTITAP